MRYNIATDKNSVTIQTELDVVADYVKIQNLLHNNTISLKVAILSVLRHIEMPSLLLQPLVENSILHGLRNDGNTLSIQISVEVEQDAAIIYVSDNGIGAQSDRLEEIRQMLEQGQEEASSADKKASIGLWNVNQRLVLMFGQRSALQISRSETGGFSIAFRVPLQQQPVSPSVIKL
jgi:two-component system sensor histidine kinase YesM